MGIIFLQFLLTGLASAAIEDQFQYRFLWPRDSNEPGKNLLELKANLRDSAHKIETRLGDADIKYFDLVLPSGELVAQTEMISITARNDVLIFRTQILKPITAPTGVYEKPAFALPAIKPVKNLSNVLNFKIEEFITPSHRKHPTTGPVVMYSDSLDVLIMSPLDNFMSAMQAPVNDEWHCGFGGLNKEIPADTQTITILVSGKGINDTMMKWGELVQKWHNHKPADPYADVAMSRLGYWTDNGSYYYYRTEPGKTYAETLLAVKSYADQEGIPYGYFQLDSWFYPKAEIDLRSSHNRGGVLLWEPNKDMFPEGLDAFQKQLGLPLVAHNRYVSDESPYCEKYKCVYHNGDRRRGAYPADPKFWDEIMDNAVRYGVKVYEQDWLYTHMDMIPWMREGIHNAESWYDAMANAAEKRGLTMQLCMASPEFLMQALKHPNETHVRTSHDYKGGIAKAFFWVPFHKAGLFAWSVGLWPFKDNFQTTAGQRPTYNIIPEANPMEEALVAALSGGPVGPSDRIAASDPELILRTCRKDGLLLKPDRPATPLDIMFIYNQRFLGGKKPWVVSTESKHEIGRTVYLAAFNLWPMSMYEPWVSFPEIGISGKHLVFNYLTGDYEINTDKIHFGTMKPEKAYYYILCPVLANGIAVIGETGKFITMSAKRFPSVKLEKDSLVMRIEGVAGEKIGIALYSEKPLKEIVSKDLSADVPKLDPGLINLNILIPESGKTELRIR